MQSVKCDLSFAGLSVIQPDQKHITSRMTLLAWKKLWFASLWTLYCRNMLVKLSVFYAVLQKTISNVIFV